MTSEDDVILKETESDANKNNFVPPTNIFEKQNFSTLNSNLSEAPTMSVTSLQDETASVVNVNNSIVDNMNTVSISKPDNDLPFVEEVHHNRMRRNADNLKSSEVIN